MFDKLSIVIRQIFILLLILILIPSILVFLIITFIELKENPIFVQERIGKNFKIFNLIKIKTMKSTTNIDKFGNAFTEQHRIKYFGKILRKYKLDELLQLINILKGDMNIYGPRPETKDLIKSLKKNDSKIIVSVKPGLLSYSSIKYFYEEEIISKNNINEKEYFNKILSDKIKLNKAYIKEKNLIVNILIFFKILKKIFYK